MKKILIMLTIMVLTLALALSACGAEPDATAVDQDMEGQSADNQDASDAAEESDLAYIQDKGVLLIGITDFAPMNYRDTDGSWIGFDTEFAEAVCEKLGLSAEFVEIDWDNKILELEAKSLDCVWNGMTLTDEVLNAMSCTKPYINNAQVVVMNADAIDNYDSIESLAELSFAAEAGSAGEEAIQENGLEANYTAVASQADALLEVSSGSSDACVIDITMAAAMTGAGTSYETLAYGLELTTEEYGIGFRKDSDMAATVDEIIDQLAEDGTLQALADKYDLSGALVINQ